MIYIYIYIVNYFCIFLIAGQCWMSSSKSKKRSSSAREESVDMDTNIPSEHQSNDPIEIEEEEEASERVTQSKIQVARKSTQRAKCWEHFEEFKENGKRMVGKCKYYGKIYMVDSSKNGMKNLKIIFQSVLKIQIIKANRHKLSWFLKKIKIMRVKLD